MELGDNQLEHRSDFECFVAWQRIANDAISRLGATFAKVVEATARTEKVLRSSMLEQTKTLARISDAVGVDWWDGDFPLDEVLDKIKNDSTE